ncbi:MULTISPECIES: hypothetical protein [Lactobacillus]|uniref:hypothetical protein n=1 Tax=Lactobacillus TaxID=1578 RepID=UPI001432B867|nr:MULTISPECIES: hypothetical protein [Lactobacillus]MBD0888682.1 hypothetical protein [Lactobacillus gasseri]
MALLIENIYVLSYWRSSFPYPTDVGASVGFFVLSGFYRLQDMGQNLFIIFFK